MKPVPPFDAEKARAERVAFWTRSAKQYGKEYVEDEKMLDVINHEVMWMKRDWASTWSFRQIQAGGNLLLAILESLSSDDRMLIEDYLDDRRNEACAEGYHEGRGDA